MLKRISFWVGCLVLTWSGMAQALDWKLSSQSEVGFSIRSLGVSIVTATFPQVQAKMHFEPEQLAQASTEFTLQVERLMVSKPSLRNMMMSEDLFNAQQYKTVHFKSSQFKSLGKHHYQILGQLTLRGITQPVIFDTTLIPVAGVPKRLQVNSKTVINRSDFGMKKAFAGVGENVHIHLIGQWNAH